MAVKLWQLGAPGTWTYRLYDYLRTQLNHQLVRYLLDRAVTDSSCIVLEAGSGPALASSVLARDNRVTLSAAMYMDVEALQKARDRDASLSLVVADLHALPFRSESIHVAWNSSTMEHLDRPDTALEEMARVTRVGGKVFVGVPYLYGPLGVQRLMQRTSVGMWIGTTFDAAELGQLKSGPGAGTCNTLLLSLLHRDAVRKTSRELPEIMVDFLRKKAEGSFFCNGLFTLLGGGPLRGPFSGGSFLEETAPRPPQRTFEKHNGASRHCADLVVRHTRTPLYRPARNLSTAGKPTVSSIAQRAVETW